MNEEPTLSLEGLWKGKKLEDLLEEDLHILHTMSKQMTLNELLDEVEYMGIETSRSSLHRFLQWDRQREFAERGEGLKKDAEKLAERKSGGKFREGAMEAVRQRLYEEAVEGVDPKAAMRMFSALAREEDSLRRHELELERTRIAAAALELRREQTKAATWRAAAKLLGEVVGILRDERLDDGTKFARVRERALGWKEMHILECKMQNEEMPKLPNDEGMSKCLEAPNGGGKATLNDPGSS